MNEAHEIALAYLAAGFSVIPVFCDGTKRPAVSWKDYQTRRATEDEVRDWFTTGPERGIGVICGAVSGGLEVLDFDEPDFYEEWVEALNELAPGLLERLSRLQTPSGLHVWYRCETIEGNQKLAQTESAAVAIETRGEGGYVIAPGSPLTVHPSGNPYHQVSGPRVIEDGPPWITPEERGFLFQAAKVLNRFVRSDRIEGGRKKTIQTSVEGSRPGDAFNREADLPDLIGRIGGRAVYKGKDDEIRWARPGKEDKGWSATTGHCTSKNTGDLFYVFSSGWEPFEPDRAYSAFAVYTLYYHQGDYQAAARDLLRQGYGAKEYPDLEGPLQKAAQEVREENKVQTRERVEEIVGGLRRASRVKVTNLWDCRSADLDDRPWNQESIDTRLASLMIRAGHTYTDIIRVLWVHRADEPAVEPDKVFDVKYMAGKLGFIREKAATVPKNQDLGERAAVARGEENAAPTKREQERKEEELQELEKEEFREAVESNQTGIALEEFRKRTGLEDIYGIIRQGEDAWDCSYIVLLDNNERLLIGPAEICLNFRKFRVPIFSHFKVTLPEEIYRPIWDEVIQLFRLAAVDEVIPEDRPNERIKTLLTLYLTERERYDQESAYEGIKRREPLDIDGRLGICTQSVLNFIFARDPSWKLGQKDLYHQLRSLGFENERITRRSEEGQLTQGFYWWIEHAKMWTSLSGNGTGLVQEPVPF